MMNMYSLIGAILWIWVCQEGSAFSTPKNHPRAITVQLSASKNNDGSSAPLSSRREWTKHALTSLLATTSVSILGSSNPALADEGDTIWKTGRAPKVPGQKPKDKGDTKGTKKDPSFLRAISDCKSKCEQSPGSDGLARSSVECLAACQDICCTTYEQCTFAIVPR